MNNHSSLLSPAELPNHFCMLLNGCGIFLFSSCSITVTKSASLMGKSVKSVQKSALFCKEMKNKVVFVWIVCMD